MKVITCNKNNVCTLQITDTTGSHQFPAMQRLNISKGHAFIMVYSITSRQSLEELKPTWDIIHEIKVNTSSIQLEFHCRSINQIALSLERVEPFHVAAVSAVSRLNLVKLNGNPTGLATGSDWIGIRLAFNRSGRQHRNTVSRCVSESEAFNDAQGNKSVG